MIHIGGIGCVRVASRDRGGGTRGGMHAWEGRGGAGTEEGCGIYASERRQVDIRHAFFLPRGN